MQTVPVSVEALATMKKMVEKLDADNKMLLEALRMADRELHSVLESCNADVVHSDDDDFHECLGKCAAAIQQATKAAPVFETMEI